MAFFGKPTQLDKIEALAKDTNARVDLGVRVLDQAMTLLKNVQACVEDVHSAARVLNNKLGVIMSNQDRANEIASGIAEDTEVIARFADVFLVATANAQAEIAHLREQLAAEEADDIDLAGIEDATGKLSELADVLQAVLDPAVESPTPDQVPDVEPVDGAEVPAEETPAVTEPPADVVPGDSTEAPAEDVVAEPVEEAPATDDSVVAEPAPEAPVEEAPATEAPVEEAPATGDTGAATDESGEDTSNA